MKPPASPVRVIDLFAGPGGLGEGFAAAGFDIRLSIEKDEIAHRTLELRAIFRQFDEAPHDYYEHLRQQLTREDLFASHPFQTLAAMEEAMHAELGVTDPEIIRRRIKSALNGADPWVLIGGPPCQAYSLVGRARNKGVKGYSFKKDLRATLYREYLRIIADHWPAVFVMENVRGMLSATLDGELVFKRIEEDLRDPADALGLERKHTYSLHALGGASFFAGVPADYLIRSERHGIPQARHRVIIVGVRDDGARPIHARCVPPVRSRFSGSWVACCLRSGLSKKDASASAL